MPANTRRLPQPHRSIVYVTSRSLRYQHSPPYLMQQAWLPRRVTAPWLPIRRRGLLLCHGNAPFTILERVHSAQIMLFYHIPIRCRLLVVDLTRQSHPTVSEIYRAHKLRSFHEQSHRGVLFKVKSVDNRFGRKILMCKRWKS